MDESAILDALFNGGSSEYGERWYPRIARVLWLRFCVEPRPTLAIVGAELGISGGMVRSVEARGLRLLRHPDRCRAATAVAPRGSRLAFAVWGKPSERYPHDNYPSCE